MQAYMKSGSQWLAQLTEEMLVHIRILARVFTSDPALTLIGRAVEGLANAINDLERPGLHVFAANVAQFLLAVVLHQLELVLGGVITRDDRIELIEVIISACYEEITGH